MRHAVCFLLLAGCASRPHATVYLFTTTDCPIANGYAPEINRIVSAYAPRNIDFRLVYVDPDTTDEQAKHHAKEYGYTCLFLLDPRHEWVRKVGATMTPEAAVVSSDGSLVYRGRIDDLYVDYGKRRKEPTTRDLRDALDAVLEGKPILNRTTTAIGCFIPDPK